MSDLPSDLRRMLDEAEARRRRGQEEQSAEFFAEGRDIPDLEFRTPDCSICDRPTDFDDGWFTCEVCRVTWPNSGYGHKAERHAD